MVYREKFVAVIKANGKILREFNDLVELPFGTEYSILLKNLNNTKAVVEITIDGEDVLDGAQLVVNANSTMELEGFLRGNNTTHKFKFIEKTEEISDFRGDDIEDGIIRIEYQFEKPWWNVLYKSTYDPPLMRSSGNPHVYRSCSLDNVTYCASNTIGSSCASNTIGSSIQANCSLQNNDCNVECNDEGITVKGSESDQHFNEAYVGQLENEKHIICLKLKGYRGRKRVRRPMTVRTKVMCETCGRKWKSSRRFCGNCGTALFNN